MRVCAPVTTKRRLRKGLYGTGYPGRECPGMAALLTVSTTSHWAGAPGGDVPSAGSSAQARLFRQNQVLLEFDVRHLVGPYPQRLLGELQVIDAQGHPPAKHLPGLNDFL